MFGKFGKKESQKELSQNKGEEENPINDLEIDSLLSEEEKERKEKEKLKEEIKKEARKEAESKVTKIKRESFKYLLFNNKYLLSNLFLIGAIFFSYTLVNDSLIPTLKNIEVLKGDKVLVEKDNAVVKDNLNLLESEKDKALEYRRLNYFLDQAVPKKDHYEDNLAVILNILNESVTDYSKNKRYLSALNLKPNTRLRDVEVFNTETERILAISYNISVDGFTRYKDITDFVDLITGRVRIFHISRMTIAKAYDQKVKKAKYKLSFQMYSYYRLPQIDDFGNPLDGQKEATFGN